MHADTVRHATRCTRLGLPVQGYADVLACRYCTIATRGDVRFDRVTSSFHRVIRRTMCRVYAFGDRSISVGSI